jgi:hypothetical protein
MSGGLAMTEEDGRAFLDERLLLGRKVDEIGAGPSAGRSRRLRAMQAAQHLDLAITGFILEKMTKEIPR